jgi:hypothetical protein
MQEFDHIPIEILNLSRRTYHALVRAGILTVGDLKSFYLNRDKYHIRNIGKKSFSEISNTLEELPNNPSLIASKKKETVQLGLPYTTRKEQISRASIDELNLTAIIRGRLKNKGIRTVEDLINASDETLLNIRFIDPKKLIEIRQLLVNFVEDANNLEEEPAIMNDKTIKAEPSEIVEKKPLTWAQIIEDYFRNEKDTYSYILISRFGFSPKTLEEIAAELGVTRERVRQIQDAVVFKYLKHIKNSGSARLLKKVEKIFSEHDDNLSLIGFKSILKQEGVLGHFSGPVKTKHIRKLDLLEALICWLDLISNKKYSLHPMEFSVDIFSLVKSGKISIRDYSTVMNISTKEQRKVRRKVLFTGGITIKEASKILSKDERITALVLKNINMQKIDSQWFTLKSLADDQDHSRIPLRIAGLKMMAVNPSLDLATFHDGIRRHASRFYESIAPIYVVEKILPILGFELHDSKISTQLSTKGILSQSEKTLISAIRKNGGVASFLEIAEEFFLQNLSLPAVSRTLRVSPIADKVNDGFHILRGQKVGWQHIEIAQKRQKRFSQDDEVTHGLDGVVRLKFTVNSYAFLTGVIGAWNVKELAGSWIILDEGRPLSDAKIDESYLWGLAKVFKKMEVKMGERLELGFNTWNRTLSVRKVINENT